MALMVGLSFGIAAQLMLDEMLKILGVHATYTKNICDLNRRIWRRRRKRGWGLSGGFSEVVEVLSVLVYESTGLLVFDVSRIVQSSSHPGAVASGLLAGERLTGPAQPSCALVIVLITF